MNVKKGAGAVLVDTLRIRYPRRHEDFIIPASCFVRISLETRHARA